MTRALLCVDPDSPLAAYEQIHRQICDLIAGGQLSPGDRLPSVRQLARDLGVAPNTVVRSYGELEQDGWVAAMPRRGVVVADGAEQMAAVERAGQLEWAAEQLAATARRLGADAAEVHAVIDRLLPGEPRSKPSLP